MPALTLSPDGIAKLKQREGQVLDPVSHNHLPYTDSVGRLTIGIGHLIKPSERKKLSDKKGISDADATAFLVADVAKAEKAVNDRVKVPLTQLQFDSLVSFVFNVGTAKFTEKKCTLLRLLNQGLYTSVAGQLARWNKGVDPKTGKRVAIPGLTNRRASEAQQFKAGTTPGTPPDPKQSETSETTENSENSEAKEESEGSESKETSEGSETSEHSEDTEHSEDSEHKEDKDHTEESEHTEDSENSEDSEHKEESDGTEGSEGSEDSEHKEESDGSEGSEGSEDSEHKEESDNSEDTEHSEEKEMFEIPRIP